MRSECRERSGGGEGDRGKEAERNEALSGRYGRAEQPQSAAAGAGNPHARKQWSRNRPKLNLTHLFMC